jgi:hypothetical protein
MYIISEIAHKLSEGGHAYIEVGRLTESPIWMTSYAVAPQSIWKLSRNKKMGDLCWMNLRLLQRNSKSAVNLQLSRESREVSFSCSISTPSQLTDNGCSDSISLPPAATNHHFANVCTLVFSFTMERERYFLSLKPQSSSFFVKFIVCLAGLSLLYNNLTERDKRGQNLFSVVLAVLSLPWYCSGFLHRSVGLDFFCHLTLFK